MTLQTILLATFVAVSVGEKPEPEIAAAAREFTNAVFRCTGETVPVVAVSTAKHGRVEISATGPDRTTIDEKISYSVRDGNLFLTGNQPRAALHATYQFLMRELGVRWICPGPTGDIYPKRSGFTLKEGLSYSHVPTIRYRGFHICGGDFRREEVYEWMARNCATIHRAGVSNEQLHYGFYGMTGGHDAWLRPKFFEEHPEWYSEFNGIRTKDNFCFAAEGAFDKVLEELETSIGWATVNRRSKGKKIGGRLDIFSVFPSDTRRYCQCAKCSKQSVSDNWFAYYNRLVKVLRERHPGMEFSTLAYQGYKHLPEHVRPDALFVEYAPHSRCHAHLLDDPACELNVKDTEAIDRWYAAGVPMGEYSYEFKVFAGRTVWLPLFTIADDLLTRAIGNRHVSMIPESGMCSWKRPKPDAELPVFKQRWVHDFMLAKMYDGTVTLDAWMKDTCEKAFGPAAEPVRAYFLLMDRAWRAQPDHPRMLWNVINSVQKILTPEVRAEAERLLAEAERRARSSDALYRANVARERELFGQWTEALRLRNGEGDDFAAPPEKTLLVLLGDRFETMGPAARVEAKDAGWKLVVCTNAADFAAALPQANNVYFRYCTEKSVTPELLAQVREKIRAGGAWVFSGFRQVPLSAFTGEKDWSCERAQMPELPLALKKAVYTRPGDWQAKPHKLRTPLLEHYVPSYVFRGTGEGWKEYLRGRGKEGEPPIPYLSVHPYGKGFVLLRGDTLNIPLCKLLENLIIENREEGK